MSTTTTAANVIANADATKTPDQWFATLKRGRVYYLRDRLFETGVEQPVSEADKLYLEESAVDEVSVEGESEFQPRAKFAFRFGQLGGAPGNTPARPGRQRARQ